MEKYVEFYFPGRVFVGSNEIKVSSFDVETAKIKAPTYAIAFDFFEKDSCGKKENVSKRYWIGSEFSIKDLKVKFPQVNSKDFSEYERVVKTRTGAFYPVKNEEIIV